MAAKTYKLVVRFNHVQESNLPDLIKAVQIGGRSLHASAMLILGDNPAPEILCYGEDLVDDQPEK